MHALITDICNCFGAWTTLYGSTVERCQKVAQDITEQRYVAGKARQASGGCCVRENQKAKIGTKKGKIRRDWRSVAATTCRAATKVALVAAASSRRAVHAKNNRRPRIRF